jgi:cytochrome P450
MVVFTPYGDRMRRQRKLMQSALGQYKIPQYHKLLETEIAHLLRHLSEDPTDYASHFKRFAGSLTLLVVYGYQAKENDDPYLLLANRSTYLLANKIASAARIWPVDIFPFCMSLDIVSSRGLISFRDH